MKYTAEQTYIPQRVLQENGGWQSHLDNTKEYIVTAIKQSNPKTVRILGSGWLFDVPIDYLVEQCDRIVLTDILHPRQVIHKYSNNSKIEFETTDLTFGAIDFAYNSKKQGIHPINILNAIKSIEPISYNEDLVISVNLLSQLNVFITDYLLRKQKISSNQIIDVAQAIQQNHLNSLPINRSILITDYEEEFLNEHGALIGTKPTAFIDLPNNTSTKRWNWKFDTQMTYREDCRTNLKVTATRI
ncbi:MAG: hypothetical protein AB7S48_03145 [Bacteroidales bacterium]